VHGALYILVRQDPMDRPGARGMMHGSWGPSDLDGLRVEVPRVVRVHVELPRVRIAGVARHAVAQHEDDVAVRHAQPPQSPAVQGQAGGGHQLRSRVLPRRAAVSDALLCRVLQAAWLSQGLTGVSRYQEEVRPRPMRAVDCDSRAWGR